MVNKSLAINLWQVISVQNDREYFSFYKTVLLNKKPVAIQIDNSEFKQLAGRLWSNKSDSATEQNNSSRQFNNSGFSEV